MSPMGMFMDAANLIARQTMIALRTNKGIHLPEGNAAIIGRYPLMPVRLETFLRESADSARGKIRILEAAAGKYDLFLANVTGDRYHDFCEGIVELCGDQGYRNRLLKVPENRVYHRKPVDDQRRLMNLEFILSVGYHICRQKFQFHGRLAFKRHCVPNAGQ